MDIRKNISKIAVVQFRQIGDVLLCTPVVRVLKKYFPQAHLSFVAQTGPAQILKGNPYLDELITFDNKKDDFFGLYRFYRKIRKQKFDLVIDFLSTPGSSLLTAISGARYRVGRNVRIRKWAYNYYPIPSGYRYSALEKFDLLKSIGIDEEEYTLDLFIPPDDQQNMDRYLMSKKISPDEFLVLISPFSRRSARRWPAEYFANLADLLIEKYKAKLILQWGPGEEGYVHDVKNRMHQQPIIHDKTSIMEIAALLKRCNLVIANDGGIKHISNAVGTPTIGIYGPGIPQGWEPPGNDNFQYAWAEQLPCIGCGALHCPRKGEGYLECLKMITITDLEQLIKNIPAIRKYTNPNMQEHNHS